MDVGGGVGVSTVRAAVLGMQTLAIEAAWAGVSRIHAAVWSENSEHLVKLLWHAVAQERIFVKVI